MLEDKNEYISRYIGLLEDKLKEAQKQVTELQKELVVYKATFNSDYRCNCLPNTTCTMAHCPNRRISGDDYNTTETGY